MSARDELAAMRGELQDLVGDAAERDDDDWFRDAANAILAAGYRKPNVLGYIVVDRGGIMVGTQHKHRESAQASADEWTADCKTAGIDWEYRIAEITEATR